MSLEPSIPIFNMFGKTKNPGAHRYYLLPGQGRGARSKHRKQLVGALAVGVVFSGLLALGMWFLNRH
jgi:hypothetical protein